MEGDGEHVQLQRAFGRRVIARIAILAVAATVLAVGLAWGSFRFSKSRTHQLFAELVTRAETEDSVVALTFDDGPVPVYTDSVLATLDEFGVPATFFVTGASIEQHPELAQRVVASGHELGNHSYSHKRLLLRSPAFIRREIETTDSLIRAAGARGEIFVRPPYANRLVGLPFYLWRHDRPVVLWDLEPDTWYSHADDVTQYVLDEVRPGSIILLHVELRHQRENRVALRHIIPALQARGYRFVTLSELRRVSGSGEGAT